VIDQLYYGVCFYPEHWPESMLDDDLSRVRDAGFNYVRIGEGAWSYFEPTEGNFRFDLFDKTIDLCTKKQLKVIFGTPTYAAPAWVGHKYPDVYRWDFNRTPMKHGSRRNYSYASPRYNDLSDKITTALANQYKKAKPIFAWQIDNEFNCHMDVSYAPCDTFAFRVWLKNKYKSIDALNAAWGTRFWSQVYDDWQQIDLPHPSATYNNPTHKLDESRFISDTVITYCRRQADILRAANPKWQITHNALFGNVDGPALVKELDFWCHDQYPRFWDNWHGYAFPLVQSRSLGFPYGILEQQAGPGGQMTYLQETPLPGQLRLWAMQTFAHGAKLLSFFNWRTCPFGSEQHWHGLLDADNKDTRRLAEAASLGKEIYALPKEVWDAPHEKAFAVLRDYDNEINHSRINPYVKSPWETGVWISELLKAHVPVDQLWPSSDFGGYKVIIAPHLRMTDAALVQKYDAFVRAGGTLVLGAQSGLKDRNLAVVKSTPPGLLRKLTGVEVEDWTNLKENHTRVALLDGKTLPLCGMVERMKLRGATAIAHWAGDDLLLQDAPAITTHDVGRGKVIYVGGYLNEASCAQLVQYLMSGVEVKPVVDAGVDVEALSRRSPRWRYVWLLNHSAEPQFVENIVGRELLTDTVVDGTLKLKAFGVAIVQGK